MAPSGSSTASSTSSGGSSVNLTGPGRKGGSSKRKTPPSRSVSPSNQSAGVLFRLSREAIESICIGGFEQGSVASPSTTMLAGQPLPPSTRDYGFSYAAKERSRHPPQVAESSTPSPSAPDSPDAYGGRTGDRDDEEYRAPAKSKSRRLGHPPTPRNCISCGATKTPYWREAWSSSVLLCNACGLRYSKFRRRCMECSYVPRKEDKGSKACTKCGGPWS